MKKLLLLLACLSVAAGGCATQSGTGVKLRGNQNSQMFTAQVDLLEAHEAYQAERDQSPGVLSAVVSTVKKPFVWIKENPGKSLLATGAGVAMYFAYEEWIADDGETKIVAKTGYTQNGKNNKITIDGKHGLPPDLVQNGEGNEIVYSENNDVELEEIGAAERVSIRQIEMQENTFIPPHVEEGVE